LLLVACGGKKPAPVPVAAPTAPIAPVVAVAKKTYRTAVVGKITSLDPALISTVAEKTLIPNLVDTLFQRNVATGEIVPRACEKFEVSPNGLKIKMTLRKDLFWSTGQRIKAKDYEAGLRRLLKPKTNATIAKKLSKIQGAQEMLDGAFYNPENLGISATDLISQSELTITLIKPDPMILQTLSDAGTAPIPADTYENQQDEIFNAEKYISSGPFTITPKSSTSYLLQKNRHHRFSQAIQIDEVVFFTIKSTLEGEKMFMAGLIDQFGYPDLPLSEATLSKLAGTGYVSYQQDLRTIFLRLNVNQSPLNQVQLRQALAMSVNHQRLLQSIAIHGEKKAESIVPDQVKYYDAPHGFYANPKAALDTLSALGYCEKGECKSLPKVTLLYPDTLSMKKIALQFSTQLKQELNTNQIQLKSMEVGTFLNAVEKNDYEMALDELAIGPDEVFGFLHAFVTGNTLSGGYSNPDYDQLIQQAVSSSNSTDMKKYYREAESLLLRDVVIIPLMYKTTPILLQKRVKGFVPNVWNVHPFETLSLK
jgi:oligopeptide transport system substrate-binding protein